METKIREWLTIVTLVASIGGMLYGVVLKPTADISNLRSEIVTIKTQYEVIRNDLKWIKRTLNISISE